VCAREGVGGCVSVYETVCLNKCAIRALARVNNTVGNTNSVRVRVCVFAIMDLECAHPAQRIYLRPKVMKSNVSGGKRGPLRRGILPQILAPAQ
jgi:hypothetical protein